MITRFAPSPTGPLHLGHAYSALLAYDMAMAAGGDFLLRIEDIDKSRARPEWEAQIYDDLQWLGLWWPEPVMRQSARLEVYKSQLDALWERHLLFECTCSRKDILAASSAPQEGAPLLGPDGVIYPGTCADRHGGFPITPRPENATLRLDMTMATFQQGEHRVATKAHGERLLSYMDGSGDGAVTLTEFLPCALIQSAGDIVLARKDMQTSYHLSVVIDDAEQGITDVVRGADLREATPLHVLLQSLLGLPTPRYHHHPLIRDDAGKRLAKRDDARALSKYRAEGATPNDIRRLVGLPPA